MSKKVKYIALDDKVYTVSKSGVRQRVKGTKIYYNFCNVKHEDNVRSIVVVGVRTVEKKENREFTLKLGYAICHPEDEFDLLLGINTALKMVYNSHRELRTNSYSMLSDDRCLAIVDDEMSYIQNHPENYLTMIN